MNNKKIQDEMYNQVKGYLNPTNRNIIKNLIRICFDDGWDLNSTKNYIDYMVCKYMNSKEVIEFCKED